MDLEIVDQGFPWVSSVLEDVLNWCHKSAFQWVFLMQPSPTLPSKLPPKRNPHNASKLSSQCFPPNIIFSPILSVSSLMHMQSTSVTFVSHFYLDCLYQKNQQALSGNLQNSKVSVLPLIRSCPFAHYEGISGSGGLTPLICNLPTRSSERSMSRWNVIPWSLSLPTHSSFFCMINVMFFP